MIVINGKEYFCVETIEVKLPIDKDMTARDEFSKLLENGNYSPKFKEFLERETIKYLEMKCPWLSGKFKCEITDMTGKIKRIDERK